MYSDKYYFEKWVEFPPISAKGIFDKVSPPKLRNIRNYTPFIEKIKRKAEVYEVFTQLERAFNSIYSDETFEIVKETGCNENGKRKKILQLLILYNLYSGYH